VGRELGIRRGNLWRLLALAFLYFFYYQLGWELVAAVTDLHPILVHGTIVPMLIGMVAYLWYGGPPLERAGFVAATPLVPVLLLGLETQPEAPGMHWVALAALQLPYWLGALAAAGAARLGRGASPRP